MIIVREATFTIFPGLTNLHLPLLAIIFVSEFHPTSNTLYDTHLSPASSLRPNAWSSSNFSHLNSHQSRAYRTNPRGPSQSHYPSNDDLSGTSALNAAPGLSEKVLWSYIVQLASAIKMIHNAGLAARCLESSRVLITGDRRIRIGGIGILDVLAWEGNLGGNQGIHQVRLANLLHHPPGRNLMGSNSEITARRSVVIGKTRCLSGVWLD